MGADWNFVEGAKKTRRIGYRFSHPLPDWRGDLAESGAHRSRRPRFEDEFERDQTTRAAELTIFGSPTRTRHTRARCCGWGREIKENENERKRLKKRPGFGSTAPSRARVDIGCVCI